MAVGRINGVAALTRLSYRKMLPLGGVSLYILFSVRRRLSQAELDN